MRENREAKKVYLEKLKRYEKTLLQQLKKRDENARNTQRHT